MIALCSHRGYSPANIEVWDKDDKWIADLWRQAESMLAASPTPPAEQQAQPDECFPGEPKVAVPQGLIGAACFAIRNKRDGGKVLEQLRRYSVGDRSQPLAPQQAAPKAVPGEQFDPEGFRAWVLRNLPDDTIIGSSAWWADRLTAWAQRFMTAAPQQEAQEPAAWLNPWRADQVTTDYDAYGERGIPLYTAPQPAPAELERLRERISKMGLDVDRAMRGHVNEQSPLGTARLAAIAALAKPAPAPLSEQDPLQGAANWLAQAHGQFCVSVLQGCLMIGHNRAKRLHDAALAAQGGK